MYNIRNYFQQCFTSKIAYSVNNQTVIHFPYYMVNAMTCIAVDKKGIKIFFSDKNIYFCFDFCTKICGVST